MSRALRINMPGGWYHITARGNERRPIFRDDEDYGRFLSRLAETVERFRCRLYAYVLMENHYHLQLETREANLSRAMQFLNGSYSLDFNQRHHRSGHLFRGRFHAVILDPAEAALEVSRYLHLNPLRTRRFGLSKREQQQQLQGRLPPAPAEAIVVRLRALRKYRWSSYRAYIAREGRPAWLSAHALLKQVGLTPRSYQEYVEKTVREGRLASPWEQLQGQLILGSSKFVDQLRTLMKGDARQQPALRALERRARWEQVVTVVEDLKQQPWEQFRDRYGDWGRDLALWLAWKCTGLTLKALAQRVGGIDYVSVGSAIHRFGLRCTTDPSLAALRARALRQLQIAEM